MEESLLEHFTLKPVFSFRSRGQPLEYFVALWLDKVYAHLASLCQPTAKSSTWNIKQISKTQVHKGCISYSSIDSICFILAYLTLSCLPLPTLVEILSLSYSIFSSLAIHPPLLSFPTISCSFLTFPNLPILSYPFLPFLSFPILFYPFLSFPILSYPFLSHPIYPSMYLSNAISSNLI